MFPVPRQRISQQQVKRFSDLDKKHHNSCSNMQGSGKTYEISGETTEWEDILISKGITTKEDVLLSKGLNPEDV
jgi:hypothetical protein